MKTGQRGPLPPNRWSFDNIKQKIGEQVLENNMSRLTNQRVGLICDWKEAVIT